MTFDRAPWRPYARVMSDYFAGKTDATLVIYDDFERDETPIAYFFREEAQFSPVDRVAVSACHGRILDVGAGAGCHSLALQQRGLEVLSLETLPELVGILRARGARNVRSGTIYDLAGETFDTVLMMMNGLGLGETLEGLKSMLDRVRTLLRPGGQLLADSCDLRLWDAAGRPDNDQLYRPDGRYLGELHFQLEYEGEKGAPFQQLYVDPDTLGDIASQNGWRMEGLATVDPAYLVRLTPV